jgi:putative DNA primase/helicase
MFDTLSQFLDAIRSTGLQPPDCITPGKLQRFPGIGKCNGNNAGWCILFYDGLGGCFGDWSSGFSENWQAKRGKPYSRAERIAFKHRAKDTRTQSEVERNKRYSEAAEIAVSIWDSAQPAMFHEYLRRKQVLPLGVRVDQHNNLLVPLTDGKEIHSLQFIQPDGTKRFLAGGRTKGMFYQIKPQSMPEKILICEGFATGATLYMDTKLPVLVAFNAGNLKTVATTACKQWPDAELTIAGDDDREKDGNPGATKARQAAIATGALVALPQWPGDAPKHLTDFNDLACWCSRGSL